MHENIFLYTLKVRILQVQQISLEYSLGICVNMMRHTLMLNCLHNCHQFAAIYRIYIYDLWFKQLPNWLTAKQSAVRRTELTTCGMWHVLRVVPDMNKLLNKYHKFVYRYIFSCWHTRCLAQGVADSLSILQATDRQSLYRCFTVATQPN